MKGGRKRGEKKKCTTTFAKDLHSFTDIEGEN